MKKIVAIAAAAAGMIVLSLAAAGPPDFEKLSEDFVYGTLAMSPVSATSAGYHQHEGKRLDEMLDDYSRAGLARQRDSYARLKERLDAIKPASLDPQQRADARLMKDQIELVLLDFDSIRSYVHNPTGYVELVGNALFAPFTLDYAPKTERFRHIIRRLEKVPSLMKQARENLVDSPDVWTRVAREENDGNIALIDQTLRAAMPAELKADYDKAAGPALESLRAFNAFLENDLSKNSSYWRLGKRNYDLKFRWALDVGKTPEQVLAEAQTALESVQDELAGLARPKSIREALDDIAKQHATADTYMSSAEEDLRQATAFVRDHNIVPLPGVANLKVIPTPEFMRGIYGVGGFNPAPTLEPQLGAFYWVTPIEKSWSKERADSKLREYNEYGMQELTIHEAMPGHYVQFEYANRVEPKTRRMLRNLASNGPYVEGWATYTQQMMSEEGYLNNSVPLRMTFLKQMLRVVTNAILDIRLQTMDMTDEQAMDLMLNQAYQEKEEAVAKLQRAKLSSAQLPLYFVGWRGWLDVRAAEKKRLGSAFSLSAFHERALKQGAVPLPILGELIAGR